MRVRLTHIDGKLPNLALMRLAKFHRDRGDEVHLTRAVEPSLFEKNPDRVYGSAIFTDSAPKLARFITQWPGAILGGTGTVSTLNVESITGDDREAYDYSLYPDFKPSLGFTQRGCRLRCGFCVVPKKEGRPRSVNSIKELWRGEGHPKEMVLLDNDFFGQPKDQWRARIRELQDGDFKVSFNQGINIRLVDDEAAAVLASVRYYDDGFKDRRLYTAWDNYHDSEIFFKGVDRLERAGIPPKHLMVYMLVGYDPEETWERIFDRFNRMVELGIRPYPMVYDKNNADPRLRRFQRWVIKRLYEWVPWEQYRKGNWRHPDNEKQQELIKENHEKT